MDDSELPPGSLEVLTKAIGRFLTRVKDMQDAPAQGRSGDEHKRMQRLQLFETLIPECYYEVCDGLQQLEPGATWSCPVSR